MLMNPESNVFKISLNSVNNVIKTVNVFVAIVNDVNRKSYET